MEKVYGYHLKWGCCANALRECFSGNVRLLLLDAWTFVGNEVLDFLLHVWPVEPRSRQIHHSIYTKVTHFDVKLLVNQLLELCGEYELQPILSMTPQDPVR